METDEDTDKPEDINDNDRAEMGRLVAEGNTSGILDRNGYRISWKLDADIFEY